MRAADPISPNSDAVIPVVLFAHARPQHLGQVLRSLRENRVPRILAYSDGPRTQAEAARVEEVRRVLREVDWADLTVIERAQNLGLGRNVRAGVGEVAALHSAFIVCLKPSNHFLKNAFNFVLTLFTLAIVASRNFRKQIIEAID